MKKTGLKRVALLLIILMISAFPIFAGAAESSSDQDKSPKYIFIIIGDGMGFGHLEIGKLFSKVISGDMSAQPLWADFPTQLSVTGGVDSSQGGTMLATGTVQSAGPISVNEDEKPLVTIMDIAKTNGLSTGVISTTSLVDATPSTFLSHAASRSMHDTMINGILTSDVDFIAGGGLDMMFTESDIPDIYKRGAGNDPVTRYANQNIALEMEELGYDTYLGLPGAQKFFEAETMGDKTLAVFTRGNTPFYYIQHMPQFADKSKDIPSLAEISDKGIRALSPNEDGFCIMIEEGAIDDACHAENTRYIAAEMGELDRTLAVVLNFYEQHPDETLIILTADHETGDFRFREGTMDALSEITEVVPWNSDASEIRDFVYRHFKASASAAIVEDSVTFIEEDTYGNVYDNRVIAAAEITSKAQFELGVRQSDSFHSHQTVPLMVMGAGHEAFAECDSIDDIAHVICDVAGWHDRLGRIAE